jgi:hypothetical protein
MPRLVSAFAVSLFLFGVVFCHENVAKTATKLEETESQSVHDEEGNGVFILNKKGDSVKIRSSLYEELNIFCHTGWFISCN